tara:strand:- start:56 stop:412 length:357 start_codon:yes stop_codon:yes gene_type:complete
MAQFAIEIADEDVSRVLGAIAANYNRPVTVMNPAYDPNVTIANPNYDPSEEETPSNPSIIPDPNQIEFIDNPETLPQFANRIVRQFLAEHVAAHEIKAAKEAAAAAANTSVNIFDPQA